MPPRPPKPCKKCKVATTNENGFCDKHQHLYVPPNKAYDRKRGSPSKRGYDTAWRKCRESFLKSKPLCEECQKEGRITPANEVHHIIPLEEGGERLAWSNLMALCKSCHSKITNEWRWGK